jgi:ribosomal protein S18 acetylase RimI-like enzyme
VVRFRSFQNTDPPHLASIWNEAFPGRAAYLLRNAAPLDRWLFSKPYFDAKGLIVAEDEDRFPVGFIHAGFGPNGGQTQLDYSIGITCIVALRYSHRKQGIGKQLLKLSEEYLISRGAKTLYAGSQKPLNPFYFGLYGGCDSPGFLAADTDASPFFQSQGYQPGTSVLVFQRKLDQPLSIVDTRFANLKRRFDIQVSPRMELGTWWEECIRGQIEPEPMQFRMEERRTGMVAASLTLWEMESYSWRWNFPAAGVIDLAVRPEFRRQGLGKYLYAHVLRYLQEQFFGVVETQCPEGNVAAESLFRSLGFEVIDVGRAYRREVAG